MCFGIIGASWLGASPGIDDYDSIPTPLVRFAAL